MACAVDPRSGPVAAVRNPVGCSCHRTGSPRSRARSFLKCAGCPHHLRWLPHLHRLPLQVHRFRRRVATRGALPLHLPAAPAGRRLPEVDHDIHRHEDWCIQCLSCRVTPRRADCDVGRPQFAGTERFQGRTALTAVFPLGRSRAALGTSPCSICDRQQVQQRSSPHRRDAKAARGAAKSLSRRAR